MAVPFNKYTIGSILHPYMKWSNGYAYLPEAEVEHALDAICRNCSDVFAVQQNKNGVKKLVVKRLVQKTMRSVAEVYIR
ncbi:MAG: hypothetical protein IJI26_00940 [Clostridia bacterium]|nr:hypothetical protein [Clostridia bacterium]